MDELINNVGSLTWWISVVLVGILINLVSAYLKSPLDRALSAVSEQWRARSALAREADEKVIAYLRSSMDARERHWRAEVRARFQALVFFVLGIMFLLFYVMIRVRVPSVEAIQSDPVVYYTMKTVYYGSIVGIILGAQSHMRASKHRRDLRRAEHEDAA
jgi:hypothetical protein